METYITMIESELQSIKSQGHLNAIAMGKEWTEIEHDHHHRSASILIHPPGPPGDRFHCSNLKAPEHICYIMKMTQCTLGNSIAVQGTRYAPYLYPFSMEYSILIVGIWFIMWDHVGMTEHHVASQTRVRFNISTKYYALVVFFELLLIWQFVPDHVEFAAQKKGKHAEQDDAMFTKEDCATSGLGLAAGTAFLALAVVGLITFGTLGNSKDPFKQTLSFYLADSIHALLLLVMILSSIKVYSIISELHVNPHPVELLDDLLLFVCIPSHIVLAICVVAPSLYYIYYLGTYMEAIGQVVVNVLMV